MDQHASTNDSAESTPPTVCPIAVIGMSCRFAGGVSDPAGLWRLLVAGGDGWSAVPEQRFDGQGLYHAGGRKHGRHSIRGAYFLQDDISRFDARFFNIPAEAANTMDPQLRLLLQGTYEAIENAGIPLDKLSGSNTSIFVGAFGRDHPDALLKDIECLSPSFMTGNGAAILSNRLSHFYNLKGPSMTLDTACSSSMVALHLAAQSIRNGESDISIVAASSLLLNPDFFVAFSQLGVTGPGGKCYSMDHRAEGYGRGEGIAVIVLKKAEGAMRDGDYVHCIIRGSAVNQDGRTETLTSPSMVSQRELIRSCYEQAGLDMAQTGYVEAHATGTAGDATEVEAIAATLGKAHASGDPLYIGTLKPNIGHTEPASGLASLIKTSLLLRHQMIPPNINFESPHPRIPLDEWNLRVPISATPWPIDKPLRASVNNFGYGGTNTHVILEAPPKTESPTPEEHSEMAEPRDRSFVYVTSSKDAAGGLATNQALAEYIRSAETTREQLYRPADLAYTLSERRSRFPYTTAIRARSLSELATRLATPGRTVRKANMPPCKIGFIFNGQGGQWHAMGRELIDTYDTFRSSLTRADAILQQIFHASWSLLAEMSRDESESQLHRVDLSPPISVALQLCLVDLLQTWGITPSAVVSHSSGEIAAAYAAGTLSFTEALGVAYHRGSLSRKHQKLRSLHGGMLAARLSAEEAHEYLEDIPAAADGKVVVACVNSPNSVTLSGDCDALEDVKAVLNEDAVFSKRLKVPCAYHSPQMQHMAQDYKDALDSLLSTTQTDSNRCPRVPFASPVTGTMMMEPLKPHHWVDGLTSPVLFAQALQEMAHAVPIDCLLEIGPHDTLSGPARQTLTGSTLPYLSCLRRSKNAVDTMQDVACELIMIGHPVVMSQVNLLPLDANRPPRYVHDLPSYVWNHHSRYLLEPRIVREHRFPRSRPHPLLGTPITGTNWPAPSWRNILRVDDIPWLSDHQLQSQVVFPGAGYVSMAIEAIRTLTPHSVVGYRLRDFDIAHALVVPSSLSTSGRSDVEIVFTVRPCPEKELDHEGWFEFELFSVEGSSWTRHCTGSVKAEMHYSTGDTSAHSDAEEFLGSNVPSRRIPPDTVFSTLRKMEFQHGPAFQNLIGSRVVGNKSSTRFSKLKEASGKDLLVADLVLHPSTLDSVFQSCFSMLDGLADGMALVPRSVRALSIPTHTTRDLQALAELKSWHPDHVEFEVRVVDEPCVGGCNGETESIKTFPFEIRGLCLQILPDKAFHDDHAAVQIPRLHSKTTWELDISQGIPDEVKNSLQVCLSDSALDFQARLRLACYHMMVDACSQVHDQNIHHWASHHQKFYHWMNRVVRERPKECITDDEKQRLYDSVASENSIGELTCRVGKHLANIVQGHIAPLELMHQGDLLNRYYRELPQLLHGSDPQLKQILRLYAVKEPGANVLEIGAGTGGTTEHVLNAFAFPTDTSTDRGTSIKTSLLGHYDFTDISAGFFAPAKSRFADWSRLMDYRSLNIEMDPTRQGFAPGTYDLIVAAQVLHATANLGRTLSNVRKLLKPRGKLVMLESTQDTLDRQLVFGTLPGWWLGEEEHRQASPNVSLAHWDKVLRATGFSGVEFDLSDSEESCYHATSIIIATAEPTVPSTWPAVVRILYEGNRGSDWAREEWYSALAAAIRSLTRSDVVLQPIEDVDEVSVDDAIIATMELDSDFLHAMDGVAFEQLRTVLVNSYGVLWLSRGGVVGAECPLRAQIQGVFRTLRREDSTRHYVYLDFDSASDAFALDMIPHVTYAFREAFDASRCTGVASRTDWEYGVRSGKLYVPRLWPDAAQDKTIHPSPSALVRMPWRRPGRTFTWNPSSGGTAALQDIVWIAQDEKQDVAIGEDLVEIEARAFGLNFQDLMVAAKMIRHDEFVAHESSGVITRIGAAAAANSEFEVGQRVCGVFQGRFRSTPQALWTSVVALPDEMTWEQGASVPYAYGTAYIALFNIACLRWGERVLIHSAAGGLGQAAVVLARHVGAEVFVSCGSPKKRVFLTERYGIPADHIFSSRDPSFARDIMVATHGQGVDVVLNSLRGPLLKASWECIARFGRFVEVGKVDIQAARSLSLSPFARNVTFASMDLIQYSECKGDVLRNALVHSMNILQDTTSVTPIRPLFPITTYPVSELREAFQFMRTGTHMGKLVLVPHRDDQVMVQPRPPSPLSLDDPDCTYLIVGGLGGLGHAIASWMITQASAKSVLVVSRNAESNAQVAALQLEATSRGAELHVRNCDVADPEAVRRLLADVAQSPVPPIAGVIHSAGVLHDTIFERMTFEQWSPVVRPKIAGTWTLHECLPDARFFIMLSSATGIMGNASQANYVAANTFQDALARHRTARGQPAVAIDLGPIREIGFLARNSEELRRRTEKSLSMEYLSSDHVISLVEDAIRHPLRPHPDDSQIITCMAQYSLLPDQPAVKNDKRLGTLRLGDVHCSKDDPGHAEEVNGVGSEQAASARQLAKLLADCARLRTATTDDFEAHHELVVAAMGNLLAAKVADYFNVPFAEVDPGLSLPQHGVDSLVAVDFRNWVSNVLHARVATFDILQSPSITHLAALVAATSSLVQRPVCTSSSLPNPRMT